MIVVLTFFTTSVFQFCPVTLLWLTTSLSCCNGCTMTNQDCLSGPGQNKIPRYFLS